MTTSAFPKLKTIQPRQNNIQDATLRDFSGGLRTVESDVTLKSNYAVVLDNMFVNEDFSQTLRFGTKLFAQTADGTTILDIRYFAGSIIACLSNGQIMAIDNNGTVITIWSTAIAATRPGAPAGWGTTATHIDSTEDNGKLIITNNVDKPVIINSVLFVEYLQDLVTLTNINTPIGRHIAMVDNFCVMSFNDEDATIAISTQGASGTWVGDPAPNNAITYNVGGYVQRGSGRIIALHAFKNRLLVFFVEAVVVVELGVFNDVGVHTPKVLDTIYNAGLVSHRAFYATETDFVFLSIDGINAAKRNVFGTTFDSRSLSDENIQSYMFKNVSKIGSNTGDSFTVADKSKNKIFFFIRKEDNTLVVLVLSHSDNYRKVRWSTISGWDFKGGCVSAQKRIFFFKENKIYQYGNDMFLDENFYADNITVESPAGDEITFDWEFPWLDMNERVKRKTIVKLIADTIGSADFNLDMFVDKLYKDEDNNYTPALSMQLRAGSVTGYGTPSIGYGGGRRTNDERFFGFPLALKLLKIRIHGQTRNKLTVSSISLLYSTGKYKR